MKPQAALFLACAFGLFLVSCGTDEPMAPPACANDPTANWYPLVYNLYNDSTVTANRVLTITNPAANDCTLTIHSFRARLRIDMFETTYGLQAINPVTLEPGQSANRILRLAIPWIPYKAEICELAKQAVADGVPLPCSFYGDLVTTDGQHFWSGPYPGSLDPTRIACP